MALRSRSVPQDAEVGWESIFTEGVRLPDDVRFPQYRDFVYRLHVEGEKGIELVRLILRDACLKDLYVLARLLGYDDPTWHWDNVHIWIANKLIPKWRASAEGQHFLFAPRGTAKTAIEEAEIVQEILRNPNVTIGVGSWELSVAVKITRAVKLQLEKPILLWLFPEILPSEKERMRQLKWTEDMMTVKRTGTATKDATLSAFSLKSPATSQHFDLVLLDDVVEAENSATDESIEAVKRRMLDMRSLRKTPASRIEVRGTMWDPDDWHCAVLMESKNWDKTVIPVLLEDPAHLRDPFIPEFVIERGAMEPWDKIPGYFKVPIFPSVKPLHTIESDLDAQGEHHFTGQMLGRMREAGGAYWPEPCLHFDPAKLEPPFASYQFVDLATETDGKQDKKCDSVVSLFHVFPGLEYRIWIWDIFIGKTWDQLVTRIFDNNEHWGAPALIEEIGAFQNFEANMIEEARRRGRMCPHSAVKHRGDTKSTRINACGTFYKLNRILSRDPASCLDVEQREAFTKYENQKRRYPRVKMKDILDTVADCCLFGLPPTGNSGSARVHHFRERHASIG